MNRPLSTIRSSIAVARWENSCIYSKICCSSSTQRQNSRVKHHKKAKQLKYCLYFLLAAKKSTVIVSFRLDSSVIFENISNIDFERASRNPHFDFRSVIHILFPFPPTGRDMRRKPVRSFIPCHFIILGEQSAPPRICESQTS